MYPATDRDESENVACSCSLLIMSKPPIRVPNLAPAAVSVESLPDGGMILRNPSALADYPRHVGHWLRHWAERARERTFLAERGPGGQGWRRVSYGEAAVAANAIAAAMLARGLGPRRPVAILSGNSVDQGLLALGAMQAGVPVAPVSPAYSLVSKDFASLRHVLEQLQPGLIYLASAARFGHALGSIRAGDMARAEIVTSEDSDGHESTAFVDLLATRPGPEVESAFDQVGPDSVAKILFTSGSTGTPKGVINTQRMLCSNQQAIAQCWPFINDRVPVLVDWLPWSHTFGSNHNFNLILRNGGALYIDPGKPLPGQIEATVASLREVSPTIYFNVPRGFDALLPFLESDEELRERFFAQLDAIFYAGAALPQSLWERLEALAIAARGERVLMLSAWGSTETAPMATTVHYPIERAGVIGLPAPGCEIKLAPSGDKLEMRVRGPNVTPGYWRASGDDPMSRPELDSDGFLPMGDAGRLADPERPELGLVFDGRTAESFKLSSGTWVHVGQLRIAAIAAAAPVIQDAVVTGHDGREIGLLIFPSLAGCRSLCSDIPVERLGDMSIAQLVERREVRDHLVAGLRAYNREHPQSSARVARVAFLTEPPSIDEGEITDKGYINQRAVLTRRAEQVERLHRGAGDAVLID